MWPALKSVSVTPGAIRRGSCISTGTMHAISRSMSSSS